MKNTTGRPSPSREVSTPQLRRVRATGRRHRGGLVRRMLMLADIVGLCLAFALAAVLFRTRIGSDPVAPEHEIPLFIATLPGWVLLARLHGLYDRDEERASHSTLDDLVGVFQLVTVGSFLFLAGSWLTGLARPYPPKLLTFWVLAVALVALASCRRQGLRAHAAGVRPERRHRRRRPGRQARGAQDPRPPRVRREYRRFCRLGLGSRN